MNKVIAARLDILAAKAALIAESYRNGDYSETKVHSGLDDLLREISAARNAGLEPMLHPQYERRNDLSDR